MNKNRLNEIAQEVGAKYGFDSVTIKYSQFQNAVLRWTRSADWINFKFPDYLKSLSEEHTRELIEVSFSRIRGGEPIDYSQGLINAMLELTYAQQDKFIGRHGFEKDIPSAVVDAIRKIADDENIAVVRLPMDEDGIGIYYSAMFKTVALNPDMFEFDSKEDVVENIASNLARMKTGLNDCFGTFDDFYADMRKKTEESYPVMYSEMEKLWLSDA